MDMTPTAAPRSDQLNADDLISGPRAWTIERVTSGSSEQPVNVHLVESPGKPWRPSKGMRRVLIAAWGPESDVYAGRRVTLYRDPEVTFGKDEVGGIRISHLSHIDGPMKIALTVKRGKRTPHVVQPMPDAVLATREQGARIAGLMDSLGVTDKTERGQLVADFLARPGATFADLTGDDAQRLIDHLDGQLPTPTGDAS